MTPEPGKPVSRRELFGLLGRSLRGARDTVARELPNLGPRPAEPPREGGARRARPRKLRPPEETVAARADAPGEWTVDLRAAPLAAGRSVRVVGEGLAAPLALVRVNAAHVAATDGECPLDGSDLEWIAYADRLYCPGCASRWRLDGQPMRGPSESRLATFPVEEAGGIVRIRRA